MLQKNEYTHAHNSLHVISVDAWVTLKAFHNAQTWLQLKMERYAFLKADMRLWGEIKTMLGFPGGSVVKNPPAMQEAQEMWVQSLDQEDSRGGGNGNPLHYSCLKCLMNRGAWRATVHGVAKSCI